MAATIRTTSMSNASKICLLNSVSELSGSFTFGDYKKRPCFADLPLIVHPFPLRHCPHGKPVIVCNFDVAQAVGE